MKHSTSRFIAVVAIFASCMAGANAQKNVTLSTYAGTDISVYEGVEVNVKANRYVFTNWNTLCIPFSVSSAQLDETFGSDCRLMTLASADRLENGSIQLNFKDVKENGVEANKPYILFYSGESGNKILSKENTLLERSTSPSVSVTTSDNETITFCGAATKTDASGLYGILAKANGEPTFVNVDNVENGFYATRCFISVGSGNSVELTSNLNEPTTNISSVVSNNESVTVYNVGGAVVAKNIKGEKVSTLPAGVYVVKGQKILVK